MVHDDIRVGTGARQIDQVGVLVVVDERVERQSHGSQSVQPGAEVGAQVVAGTRAMMIVADDRIVVPAGGIAHAAKAAAPASISAANTGSTRSPSVRSA